MSKKTNNIHELWEKERKKTENSKNKRKNFRRNLDSKTRRKDWMEYADGNWDDADVATQQRIMPRDENVRRKALEQMTANADILTPTVVADDGELRGMIIEVNSGLCKVLVDESIIYCTIRGSLTAQESGFTNVVAVGDGVTIQHLDGNTGVIESILPRKSILARNDYPRRQVLVANADQLLIVAAWRNPHIWLELIDRYLIVAQRNQLPAVLCINKVDLNEEREELEQVVDLYRNLGVKVLATSAVDGNGIEALREVMRGKMSVLTGMSGVGKSSLLSAVQPGLNLRALQVSEMSGEGRHTTTQSNLYNLEMGGCVVDTPGIREFGLNGVERRELSGYFPEIASLSPRCRFSDCLHVSEPECAVLAAVEADEIAESRHHSYLKILEDLK
ncbi:MAG: ribosome small subunit-dependent GTPase A [Anaerolineaceae bacterium]|nr:ribosome small subunit-dependent GTPase A [Anaerolineaceae bacterium]